MLNTAKQFAKKSFSSSCSQGRLYSEQEFEAEFNIPVPIRTERKAEGPAELFMACLAERLRQKLPQFSSRISCYAPKNGLPYIRMAPLEIVFKSEPEVVDYCLGHSIEPSLVLRLLNGYTYFNLSTFAMKDSVVLDVLLFVKMNEGLFEE